MKTKEEILKEATKSTLNINEGSPLHDAVMKAMEEYAQQQVKNCSIPTVVGQREQLDCDCGNSSMTWYGNDDDKKWFCFNCKKEVN